MSRRVYLAGACDPHNLVFEGILGQVLGREQLQVSIRSVKHKQSRFTLNHHGERMHALY